MMSHEIFYRDATTTRHATVRSRAFSWILPSLLVALLELATQALVGTSEHVLNLRVNSFRDLFVFSSLTMKSSLLLAATAVAAATLSTSGHASAVELTKDNFDSIVHDGGKNAFVKFLAPW